MAELKWKKSSRSGSNGGACVELAALPGGVAARDSKNPAGDILVFRTTEVVALIRRIQEGHYDLA